MGDFSPIVFVLACSMDHGREDVPMCSRITPKLVGDQLPGCLSLMLQGSTKEAFSGSTISTLGNQNIDHFSILTDGPPKIEAPTLDGDEEFIDVPDVAESSPVSDAEFGSRTVRISDISIGSLRRRQGFLARQASLLRVRGELMDRPILPVTALPQ